MATTIHPQVPSVISPCLVTYHSYQNWQKPPCYWSQRDINSLNTERCFLLCSPRCLQDWWDLTGSFICWKNELGKARENSMAYFSQKESNIWMKVSKNLLNTICQTNVTVRWRQFIVKRQEKGRLVLLWMLKLNSQTWIFH